MGGEWLQQLCKHSAVREFFVCDTLHVTRRSQTLHGTAIGLPIRPGVLPGGSIDRQTWQSHGASGDVQCSELLSHCAFLSGVLVFAIALNVSYGP